MKIVDLHVHIVALPTPQNGCMVSKRMMRSPLSRILSWKMGLPVDKPEEANQIYLTRLDHELSSSQFVQKAVLLAMDGVYDGTGKLDETHTDFLISNDTVISAAKRYPRFLAGVSINPQRRDAIDELERCVSGGACLVKVLPNAQVFDPADKRYLPFYKELVRHRLPFLCHIGYEFSLVGQDQSVGDLYRLRMALEEGVTIIAAHGCSNGLFFYEKHFKTMLEFARRYKNFFIDTSALSLPNRVGALFKLRRYPEISDRLLFGTDYPLPCFAYPALATASFKDFLQARSVDNRFDRHFGVLKSLGITIGDQIPLKI